MKTPAVCAVVITYHPNASMVDNLSCILDQTEGLVVVDNGSEQGLLQAVRDASESLGFKLIENGENLGIAEALNRGVLWAKSQGYPWVILLDQDSKLTPNFVSQMLRAWEAHPQRERIGSFHPRYVDPRTGIEPRVFRASDGGPIISMTSGALIPAWIFDKLGLFEVDYFIDQVDTEYCYRIRAAGLLVADCRDTVLLHAPGFPERQSFLGFSFEPTHCSPLRRYYLSRNRVVVFRKYFPILPRLVARSMYVALRETVKCLLAEKERVRKFRNIVRGTWDGLRGNMGKREGL